jgi:hypothetical protein
MRMVDPTFYFFDDRFKITKRIDGRSGVWDDNVWQIENGIVQNQDKDGGYDLHKFEHLNVKLDENPENFLREKVEPDSSDLRKDSSWKGTMPPGILWS